MKTPIYIEDEEEEQEINIEEELLKIERITTINIELDTFDKNIEDIYEFIKMEDFIYYEFMMDKFSYSKFMKFMIDINITEIEKLTDELDNIIIKT